MTLVGNFKILALARNFFGTVSLSGLLIERVVGEYGAADVGTSREGVAPMQGLVLWAAFSQGVAAGLTSLAPLARGAGSREQGAGSRGDFRLMILLRSAWRNFGGQVVDFDLRPLTPDT